MAAEKLESSQRWPVLATKSKPDSALCISGFTGRALSRTEREEPYLTHTASEVGDFARCVAPVSSRLSRGRVSAPLRVLLVPGRH
jgi:hypothetical protein